MSPALIAVLVDMITVMVKITNTTREALAASLKEIATKIEAGALVPNDAFYFARKSLEETKDARDRLPD